VTEVIFWVSLILVAYTYAGYPVLIWAASRLFPNPVKKGRITPSVSIVIAAYNEEKYIERKIENCLALDYPAGLIDIVIGSDGSNDRTEQMAEPYASRGVSFYQLAARQGKASVLNFLVPRAKGEIIVFTDARQKFARDAVKELVNNFADERVGCVSGELILVDEKKGEGASGIGLYWKYEKFLRRCESGLYSMLGATGAIYAIRKKLFVPADKDILLDDVFIPLTIVEQGFRAVFEPMAKAYDAISGTLNVESRRKIRTLAGNWQLFVKLRRLLNPVVHNIAIPLISHKVLRVLMPYFLAALFISNIYVKAGNVYTVIWVMQLFFYLAAFMGYMSLGSKLKMLDSAYVFCRMNIDAVKGMLAYVQNTQKVTWEK